MYWQLYALILITQVSVEIQSSDSTEEEAAVSDRDPRWLTWTQPTLSRKSTIPYLLWEMSTRCSAIRRSPRSIVRRLYAVLPYFDKEHVNGEFLHKLRVTIRSMTESKDVLHREAAFYASILIPLIFIQDYKDSWCILERFHRALMLFETMPTKEKVASLRHLQDIKYINQRIRMFVFDLPGPKPANLEEGSTKDQDIDLQDDLDDIKETRYVSELIKNLG